MPLSSCRYEEAREAKQKILLKEKGGPFQEDQNAVVAMERIDLAMGHIRSLIYIENDKDHSHVSR